MRVFCISCGRLLRPHRPVRSDVVCSRDHGTDLPVAIFVTPSCIRHFAMPSANTPFQAQTAQFMQATSPQYV